jgi:hypothetical protein
MPTIAREARELLKGCTREAINSLQYSIDDAIEKMRDFYLNAELFRLAIKINENSADASSDFYELICEIATLSPDLHNSTVKEIREILEIWLDDPDAPRLPSEEDLSELDALEWAISCGELDCDEPEKCIAILALRSIAAYAYCIESPDAEWEGIVSMPVQVARLINASNDAVSAVSAMRLIDRFHLELPGNDAKSFSEARARHAAKQRYASDPKQFVKKLVRESWVMWQNTPERYANKSAFSRDMLDKYESLKSQRVIERWCKTWEAVPS